MNISPSRSSKSGSDWVVITVVLVDKLERFDFDNDLVVRGMSVVDMVVVVYSFTSDLVTE